MFGEDKIIGEKEVKVDDKHRVILPKFTYAEAGDIIMPRFSAIQSNVLFLFNEEEYHIQRDKFESFLKEQRVLGKFTYHDILRYRRYYYGHLSFMGEKVDKSRRFLLEGRAISNLEISDKLFMMGEDNHLILCRDRNVFDEYQEKRSRVK